MVNSARDASLLDISAVKLVHVGPLLPEPFDVATISRELAADGEIDTLGEFSGSKLLNELLADFAELLLDLPLRRGKTESETDNKLAVSRTSMCWKSCAEATRGVWHVHWNPGSMRVLVAQTLQRTEQQHS